MILEIYTAPAGVSATGRGIAALRGAIDQAVTEAGGSEGFLMAVDRSSGRYVAMAAWPDEAAAAAREDPAPAVIAHLTQHLGTERPTVEAFDITESQIVKPLRIGYWGRYTRIHVRPEESEPAAKRFRDTFVPGFEHEVGLAGVFLALDSRTGDGYAVQWYDSLARLRAGRERGRESGQLMSAALPTLVAVETTELQVVFAE